MTSEEYLRAWFRREWKDYREVMQYVGRLGWNGRIVDQRKRTRHVLDHLLSPLGRRSAKRLGANRL